MADIERNDAISRFDGFDVRLYATLVSSFNPKPQEIALWIDMKSRVFFPVLFLIFIAFYFFLAFSCKLFHNCIDENDNYGF